MIPNRIICKIHVITYTDHALQVWGWWEIRQKFAVGWPTSELKLFRLTVLFYFSPWKGRMVSVKWRKLWCWVDVGLNPDLAINGLSSFGVFSCAKHIALNTLQLFQLTEHLTRTTDTSRMEEKWLRWLRWLQLIREPGRWWIMLTLLLGHFQVLRKWRHGSNAFERAHGKTSWRLWPWPWGKSEENLQGIPAYLLCGCFGGADVWVSAVEGKWR